MKQPKYYTEHEWLIWGAAPQHQIDGWKVGFGPEASVGPFPVNSSFVRTAGFAISLVCQVQMKPKGFECIWERLSVSVGN